MNPIIALIIEAIGRPHRKEFCQDALDHNPYQWRKWVSTAIEHIYRALDRLTGRVRRLEALMDEKEREIRELQAIVYQFNHPYIVRLKATLSKENQIMKILVVATWDDGFQGFDGDKHQQPADWNVGEVTVGDAVVNRTGPDSFDVTQGTDTSDDTATLTYGAFSTTVTIPAPVTPPPTPPQINGLEATLTD